jgi:Ca2+-binding EF-hand superfamily protein
MAALRLMDTNHNGMIDAEELNAQQKAFLERIQRKVGMETTLPVSIEKLTTALQNYYAAKDAKAAGQTPGVSPPASNSSSASGFGATNSSSSVSSFGGSSTAPTSSSGSTATTVGSSSSSSFGSAASGNPAEAKYRRYAEMLLKQYDKNKNGVLEREEWSEMRGDWKSADLNGDGILTVDEITAHLMGYSQRRAQQSTASTASVTAGSSTTATAAGGSSTSSWRPAGSDVRKPYRFLSPTERLPKGLPDWFLQKDVNGDGQVTMAEFSSTWNDTVAAEFATYDRNNDGVITAEECLQAEKLKSQIQAKASPSTPSPASH